MNNVILWIKITIHYSFATIEKIYPYSLVNLMISKIPPSVKGY